MRYVVTRNVSKDEEHNYAGRDVTKGEEFYRFFGATYGCVDTYNGVPLSEVDGEYPFFEFPVDACEPVEDVTR